VLPAGLPLGTLTLPEPVLLETETAPTTLTLDAAVPAGANTLLLILILDYAFQDPLPPLQLT
jgi:hypothetical protein